MPNHDITRAVALEIATNFQAEFPAMNRAAVIPKEEVIELLTQSGAVGLRMYYAMHDPDSDELNVVLCAVDSNGDDIETYKNNCLLCPPNCGEGL